MANLCNPLGDQVDQALRQNPHLRGQNLQVNRQGERVQLRGTVSSFFEKQQAQEAVRRIDGRLQVDNELSVDWD